MKIKITIPKIKCIRRTYDTHGPNRKDEIYIALYVLPMKPGENSEPIFLDNKKPLFHQVSETKTDFKKNVEWAFPIETTIDIQDFTAFGVYLALYEQDDGKIKADLSESLKRGEFIEPPTYDFKKVAQEVWEEAGVKGLDSQISISNISVILSAVGKVLLKFIKKTKTWLANDDLIGKFEGVFIAGAIEDIPKQVMSRYNGKYEVHIDINEE